MAVALLGFTVAVPQDASLGLDTSVTQVVKPWRGGENVAGLDQVELDDEDLGDLLDRLDGSDLDPDLARNLDPAALADLLDALGPNELAALGLTPEEAADLVARLRDPELSDLELVAIAALLADRGLAFVNADADARFDAGEAAYADLDGDGQVSAGDLRLGVLALLLGIDRGLSDAARSLWDAYEAAGAVGLSPPATASSRANATAATAPLLVAGFPSDRALGPLATVCVQLYSLSLTCHTRTFVQGAITRVDAEYRFGLDGNRTPVALQAGAAGTRSTAALPVVFQEGAWTPVAGLTPQDALVDFGASVPGVSLARDENGMLWARGPAGPATLSLTWAVDLAYYDLPVAADVRSDDVPAALRPQLEALPQAVGLHLAELAGATDRPYGDSIRAIAGFVRAFGVGPLPDRDEQPDDLLAYAQERVGCARHRAEAFVLATQALGIPARLVLNEAHAFAEVFVPRSGWHLVDVGACGQLQVRRATEHAEVMAQQDLPYANGDAPASQADTSQDAVTTTIDITEVPTTLRRNVDFTIAGTATSAHGAVPAGIPITFTHNRTKETPGTPFCSTQTEDGGDYRATCRLGPGTPAGSLQLVARLAPSVVAGAPSNVAYSDPPFTVQKATTLDLLGPARTSAATPSTYTAHVVDEDGAPVPGRAVTLRVDGGANQTRFTDASGRARFPLTLELGSHVLQARLVGDDTYDPSATSRTIEATNIRIAALVDAAAVDAGRVQVSGVFATADGPQAGRTLTVRWSRDPDGAEQVRSAVTGPNGRFSAQFDGEPAPGPSQVGVFDGKSAVGVDVAFARTIGVQAVLQVPARWAEGVPVPVTVDVAGTTLPVPLRLFVDGLAVADVAAAQSAPADALLTMAPGRHTVTVQAGEGVRLATAPATVRLVPVQVDVQPIGPQAPGSTFAVAGTLRVEGLGDATPVTVRGAGTTATVASGRDGSFTVDIPLAAQAPAGLTTFLVSLPELGFEQEFDVRIQRAANLAIEAPEVSLQAFGTTPIVVRGEGVVAVFLDGRRASDGGRIAVPSATWLVRQVDVVATVSPESPDLSPATRSHTMTIVNPVALVGLPLLALGMGWGTWRVGTGLRRRHAHRNRLLPKRRRGPLQVLQPVLPPRVPLAFDPDQDAALVVRLPRGGPWQVRDALGNPIAAQVRGRIATLALQALPRGRITLRFQDGRRTFVLACTVAPLRDALDAATLDLLHRIGRPTPWPSPIDSFATGLEAAGTHPDDVARLRRAAERSLYAQDALDRPAFHAFFDALDAAQRRPA